MPGWPGCQRGIGPGRSHGLGYWQHSTPALNSTARLPRSVQAWLLVMFCHAREATVSQSVTSSDTGDYRAPAQSTNKFKKTMANINGWVPARDASGSQKCLLSCFRNRLSITTKTTGCDVSGQVYWVNHRTKETSWQPPIPPPSRPLPPNWEARIDPQSGRIYYVDHGTSTTHWEIPDSASTSISNQINQPSNAGEFIQASRVTITRSASLHSATASRGPPLCSSFSTQHPFRSFFVLQRRLCTDRPKPHSSASQRT